MADRPKLLILDDPLRTTPASSEKAPPPQPAKPPSGRPKRVPAKANSQPTLGEEALQAVFGRVPRSLARRMEGAVYELRGIDSSVRQQQVLAALLWRHVDPADEASLKELAALIDQYKRASPTRRQDSD